MNAPFEHTREDINTRKLIERVQVEVRTINETVKPLVQTVGNLADKFESMSEKFSGLSKDLGGLLEHKAQAPTWLKLGAMGLVIVTVCYRMTEGAKTEFASQLAEHRRTVTAQMSDLEGKYIKAKNEAFELQQKTTKTVGGRR